MNDQRSPVSSAFQEKLTANETYCIAHNIVVHVHSINFINRMAACSVEQLVTGIFRRSYSRSELTRRAEIALAPLIAVGISPMVTVKHKNSRNKTASSFDDNDRFKILLHFWRFLGIGIPMWRKGKTRITNDPFGWKKAYMSTGRTFDALYNEKV